MESSLTWRKWRPMDLQSQRKLNKYFGLHKGMDTQLFCKSFVQITKTQHQLAIALQDGTRNNKLDEVILTGVEAMACKLAMRRKRKYKRCSLRIIRCLFKVPLIKQGTSQDNMAFYAPRAKAVPVQTANTSTNQWSGQAGYDFFCNILS